TTIATSASPAKKAPRNQPGRFVNILNAAPELRVYVMSTQCGMIVTLSNSSIRELTTSLVTWSRTSTGRVTSPSRIRSGFRRRRGGSIICATADSDIGAHHQTATWTKFRVSAVVEVAPAPLAFDSRRARRFDLKPRDGHSVQLQFGICEFPTRAVAASNL